VLAAGEPAVVLDSGQPAELVLGDGVTAMADLRRAVWGDDARLALAATATQPGDLGTAAAADATDYASATSVAINALDHGIIADGVTNDTPAWQALVNSLEGSGSVITWSGTSLLRGSIFWKRGVSLIGQGWGRSVLAKSTSHAPDAYFSAIHWTAGYSSVAAPFEDLIFADFEVDGSGVLGTGPAIHDKAIFMQHLRRCQFRNLYLHDTVGTALGTDYMRDCQIDGVTVVNAGRGWDGIQGGHAGIGIGAGMSQVENVTITNCHTIDCGHYGIFVEKQVEGSFSSRGAKIIGCTATGTKGSGFADYGCSDTLIMGNSAIGNGTSNNAAYREGITLLQGATGTQVINNIVTDNIGDGIGLKTTAGNDLTISGNQCHRNGRRGIASSAGIAFKSHSFTGNECSLNQFDGLLFNGQQDDLTVIGNRAWNNGQSPTATANGADTGIAFGGIFNGLLVGGNRCHDNQTVKSQGYGIGALSGTYTGCRIGDNNLTGNRVKGLNIAAGPLAAIELGDNTGALTTKTGSAIIADGASTVLVTHSLIATPTNVQLTPASSATVWVTTPTSTDFTVNRTGTTGALTVYWTAQIGTSA